MRHLMLISQKYQKPSTDMPKYSANNNPKDSLNTQYGIMPSNYYQVHQHHYQEDSYTFPKTKLKRYPRLWQNIYLEELSDRKLDHTLQTSSLSKRRMANYAQYKTTDLSINGQRRTAMYLR